MHLTPLLFFCLFLLPFSPHAAFGPAFLFVCLFVLFCFVFSVSCCFVLMLCFTTFWLSAALLISCRLFYRHFLTHSQNCIYTYNMYFYLYKVYSLVSKANSFLLLVCILQLICMYVCIGTNVYVCISIAYFPAECIGLKTIFLLLCNPQSRLFKHRIKHSVNCRQ